MRLKLSLRTRVVPTLGKINSVIDLFACNEDLRKRREQREEYRSPPPNVESPANETDSLVNLYIFSTIEGKEMLFSKHGLRRHATFSRIKWYVHLEHERSTAMKMQ